MKTGHKYSAVATHRDGHRFDSQAEGRYYDLLMAWQEDGTIVGFTRQVPLHFPGGVKLVVDFQVFYSDGRHEFVEVKGCETQAYLIKLRLFEQFYPWADLRVIRPKEV